MLTHLQSPVSDTDFAASRLSSCLDGAHKLEEEQEGHQTGRHHDPEKSKPGRQKKNNILD